MRSRIKELAINPRKKIFNKLACSWDQMHKQSEQDLSTIREVIESSHIAKDDVILDAGCGTGILIGFLIEKLDENGMIYALDVADKMIQEAEKKICDKRIKFLAQDIYLSDFQNDYFDKIFVFSTFPHFHDKNKIFSIFYNILKKNGKLIIFHVESSSDINNFHINRTSHKILKGDYLPNISEILNMIDKKKWEVLSCIDRKGLYLVHLNKI